MITCQTIPSPQNRYWVVALPVLEFDEQTGSRVFIPLDVKSVCPTKTVPIDRGNRTRAGWRHLATVLAAVSTRGRARRRARSGVNRDRDDERFRSHSIGRRLPIVLRVVVIDRVVVGGIVRLPHRRVVCVRVHCTGWPGQLNQPTCACFRRCR